MRPQALRDGHVCANAFPTVTPFYGEVRVCYGLCVVVFSLWGGAERNEVHARGPAFKTKCVIISDITLARGVRADRHVQHLIKSSDRVRARAEGHRPFRCDADECCSCS